MVACLFRVQEAVGSSPTTSTNRSGNFLTCINFAGVAELADAPDLGSGVYDVGVRGLSPAPAVEHRGKTRDYTLVLSFFFFARVVYRLTAINPSGKTHRKCRFYEKKHRGKTRDYTLVLSFFFFARVVYRLTVINASGKTHSYTNKNSLRLIRKLFFIIFQHPKAFSHFHTAYLCRLHL